MELFFGAAVSLIVQFLKSKLSNTFEVLAVLFALCLGAAGIYTALVETGYWSTVAAILMTAGAFYAFVIERFEGTSPDDLEA